MSLFFLYFKFALLNYYMQMWLQAIAIALPRVQDHFDVPDHSIGWLSTLMFAGMMFGAVGWGTCKHVSPKLPSNILLTYFFPC